MEPSIQKSQSMQFKFSPATLIPMSPQNPLSSNDITSPKNKSSNMTHRKQSSCCLLLRSRQPLDLDMALKTSTSVTRKLRNYRLTTAYRPPTNEEEGKQ